MYNSVYLIGRLTTDPEAVKTESGKKVMTINLAVQRSYKNSDGIYETDFIRCVLWEGIATRTAEYCHKGDLIAIRGQIRTSTYESTEKEKKYNTEVVVEKVSFLSTGSNSTSEELKKNKNSK
ncbi:MAG: single-stranded DNA-binding protein [Bacilli bacterium]|nr:single-stranded DNA-binding protein [Bacilli bacterium]